MNSTRHKFRIGAVSYLNTVPLVWGMLHGEQREQVDLSFSLPSECARQLESGQLEVGLVPVAEITRQRLEIVPGVGIACFGPVRSILLFSRVPWRKVQTVAADIGSRTSVQLARIILAERFGVEPEITAQEPRLEDMLAQSDAALIIGDPALRLDPQSLPYEHLDLGDEWRKLTGLPMVFAAWAGRQPAPGLARITTASYEFGSTHIDEIIESEYGKRGVTRALAETYLRHHIRFVLGEKEMEGLRTFVQWAGLEKTDAYATTGS